MSNSDHANGHDDLANRKTVLDRLEERHKDARPNGHCRMEIKDRVVRATRLLNAGEPENAYQLLAYNAELDREETEDKAEEARALLEGYVPDKRVLARMASKALIKRRTRFFVDIAKSHGPRLSALVYYVAVKTIHQHQRGWRGRDNAWHHSYEQWGREIGVGAKQASRLMQKAAEEGFIDYGRTGRGVRCWLVGKRTYTRLINCEKARMDGGDDLMVGYFYPRLASVLGINGSIVYGYLKKLTKKGTYPSYTVKNVCEAFPWISDNEARITLEDLFERGAIHRHRSPFNLARGRVGYRYQWSKRTPEDRKKWRVFRTK